MPPPLPDDAVLDELQILLDRVPAPLEPLDVSMLDGFLCGVLVQPTELAAEHWLPYVSDADARAIPAGVDLTRLHELVRQRHATLERAIARRDWFDPWVFELEPDAAPGNGHDEGARRFDAVYPWVAGFGLAMNAFPELMRSSAAALSEPVALLYRHLDPDDLDDAGELLEAIESLPELNDLAEAVQDLVRATMLLADVGRPRAVSRAAPLPAARRRRQQRG